MRKQGDNNVKRIKALRKNLAHAVVTPQHNPQPPSPPTHTHSLTHCPHKFSQCVNFQSESF